jgi:hypothetical protein
VRIQRPVGFSADGVGEPGIADHDDWRQVMGLRAQRAALSRAQDWDRSDRS